MEVKHEEGIFYIGNDKDNPYTKVTYYHLHDDVIVVDQTVSREEFRGQGLSCKVVTTLIDWARQEGMKILPECPYASKVMHESSQYSDMIYTKDRADEEE
ncbi:MAG: N-acetyltransferase [Clostridiaceae bacterium]|nr:N-acetyltransferase [Clostridiaceae bacterium]